MDDIFFITLHRRSKQVEDLAAAGGVQTCPFGILEGRAGRRNSFIDIFLAAFGDGEDGFAGGGVFDGKGAVGGGGAEFVVDEEPGGEEDGAVVDCN